MSEYTKVEKRRGIWRLSYRQFRDGTIWAELAVPFSSEDNARRAGEIMERDLAKAEARSERTKH